MYKIVHASWLCEGLRNGEDEPQPSCEDRQTMAMHLREGPCDRCVADNAFEQLEMSARPHSTSTWTHSECAVERQISSPTSIPDAAQPINANEIASSKKSSSSSLADTIGVLAQDPLMPAQPQILSSIAQIEESTPQEDLWPYPRPDCNFAQQEGDVTAQEVNSHRESLLWPQGFQFGDMSHEQTFLPVFALQHTPRSVLTFLQANFPGSEVYHPLVTNPKLFDVHIIPLTGQPGWNREQMQADARAIAGQGGNSQGALSVLEPYNRLRQSSGLSRYSDRTTTGSTGALIEGAESGRATSRGHRYEETLMKRQTQPLAISSSEAEVAAILLCEDNPLISHVEPQFPSMPSTPFALLGQHAERCTNSAAPPTVVRKNDHNSHQPRALPAVKLEIGEHTGKKRTRLGPTVTLREIKKPKPSI